MFLLNRSDEFVRGRAKKAIDPLRWALLSLLVTLAVSVLTPQAGVAQSTCTQMARLAPEIGTGWYGYSGIAVEGDLAMIGDKWYEGTGIVHLYQYDGSSWTRSSELFAGDIQYDWNFGVQLDLEDNRAVIGAAHAHNWAGAAYVFDYDGSAWVETAKLRASDSQGGDRFTPPNLDGERLFIGAWGDNSARGAVYYFEHIGQDWVERQKITASDGASGDRYGGPRVSVDGDRVMVGSDRHNQTGAVYAYEYHDDSWIETAKLTASDAEVGDRFAGNGKDWLDGNRVVIGAPGANGSTGTVYIFEFDGSHWIEKAKLASDDAEVGDGFGTFAVIDGDRLFIGAPGDDDAGTNAGAVYLFRFNGENWTEVTKLIPSGGSQGFGNHFDLDGNRLLISTNEFYPAAFVFDCVSSSLEALPNPVPIRSTTTLTAEFGAYETIETIRYSIDGGSPIEMTPADGAYDERHEVGLDLAPAFDTPGVHEVCAEARTSIGQVLDACILLAVYDPDGGFVTGAGWIDSPAGACPTFCGDAVGRASFGFVSKYHKGATIPSGQTNFQFKAGDLHFSSSVYDWLVIAGANAKYKGSGGINHGGDYGFMLTATDSEINGGGSADKFRIKIWDKATEAVVYDNKREEGDESYAGTELGGGNIKIHKGSSAKMAEQVSTPELPSEYTLRVYPNPFNPSTTLSVDLPEESDVRLIVYNVLGCEVSVLANTVLPAGSHRLTFDANGLPSGMYIARLETTGGTFTRRMTLVK